MCLPADFWHHTAPIQSLRKLNLLRRKPCATLEREGGNRASGDGEKEEGWKESEREMGGEQRNWKMREGLEKGQGEKKKKRGRGRDGPCVLLKVSFVAKANC